MFLCGCAEAALPEMAGERPVGAEVLIEGEALPGDPPGPWPVPVAHQGGRYLVPYRGPDGLRARVLDGLAPRAAGPLRDRDVALDGDVLVGVAAGAGLVAVTAGDGLLVVHRFDGETVSRGALALPGEPVAAAASGDAVLVATVSGRARLVALLRSGAASLLAVEGTATPVLYGDDEGFILDGAWLVGDGGAFARAPARQIPGARVFRRAQPGGDVVTLDGARWLDTGGSVDWAARDAAGVTLAVGDAVLTVGVDLTSPARATLDGGWLRAVRGDRALWQSQDGSDHLFAILDRATLRPRSPVARLPGAWTRGVVAVLGDAGVLLAWIDREGRFRVARWPG